MHDELARENSRSLSRFASVAERFATTFETWIAFKIHTATGGNEDAIAKINDIATRLNTSTGKLKAATDAAPTSGDTVSPK